MKTNEAVAALSALAQANRLELFRLLVRFGPTGLSAGEIATHFSIGKPTVSFHLKELTEAGLITSARTGRSIIYRLRENGIRSLLNFLMEDCCQGRAELCTPVVKSSTCCS